MLPQIVRSHRVGKEQTGKSRAIIVKFTSYRARRSVYSARRKCKDVFVSKDLTKKRSQLLFQARQLKRGQKIHSCWSRDGRLYIRELNDWGANTGGPPYGRVVQIHSHEDLEKYMKP